MPHACGRAYPETMAYRCFLEALALLFDLCWRFSSIRADTVHDRGALGPGITGFSEERFSLDLCPPRGTPAFYLCSFDYRKEDSTFFCEPSTPGPKSFLSSRFSRLETC